MKRIGILTFHWADDFGAMLQALALKRFLTESGIGKAEIIPYETAALRGRYWLLPYRPKGANRPGAGGQRKRQVKFAVKSLPWKLKRMLKMRSFRKKYLTKGRPIRTEQKIKGGYDLIVLGSDQIWNPDITYRLEKAYFGAVPKGENTVTLSYAASLGKPALDGNDSREFRDRIRSVDVISVREESSVPYVREQSGKRVQCMPDPSLLLPPREWEQIAVPPGETDYVLLHFTEYNEELVKQALAYGKKTNRKVISLKAVSLPEPDIQVRFGIGPAEFLGYVKNAACVFTNSFHAAVFSLIFGKDLCCMAHSTLGSRTDDLLSRFGVAPGDGRIISAAQLPGREERLKEFREQAYTFFAENADYRKAEISHRCKGCGVCAELCPNRAILMKPGQDGFSYPYINQKLCSSCGKCAAVCPDRKTANPVEDRAVYGVKCRSEQIRQRSTSGGVFYLLAEQVIGRGGCVYGAVLNEDYEVCHTCAQTLEEVLPMHGAKYVESKLGGCFGEIRDRLDRQAILFTGTPCQVAGLKAFVGDHRNLYTVDMVCHGVASPKAYARYMHWLTREGPVTEFGFRSKATGWHASSVTYRRNGNVYTERLGENPYTKLYFRGLLSRESCHCCQYASFDRFSDMTIGDYWGIEKVNPAFDDNKGVSLVILHSEKGRALFGEISQKAEVFQSDPAHCLQPQLQAPAEKNRSRDRLMRDLDTMPFDALFRKYRLLSNITQLKKRIGNKLMHFKK